MKRIATLKSSKKRGGGNMSYITAMAVNEGVIMAADRQSMKMGKDGEHIICTKTTKKLFAIGDNVGVNTGGVLYPKEALYFEKLSHTKTFNSPLEAALDIRSFFINNIQQVERVKRMDQTAMTTIIFIAGYDKQKLESKKLIGTFNAPKPEMYFINTQDNELINLGNYGFFERGTNLYFDQYVEKINKNTPTYSLQDAVDITHSNLDNEWWIYVTINSTELLIAHRYARRNNDTSYTITIDVRLVNSLSFTITLMIGKTFKLNDLPMFPTVPSESGIVFKRQTSWDPNEYYLMVRG